MKARITLSFVIEECLPLLILAAMFSLPYRMVEGHWPSFWIILGAPVGAVLGRATIWGIKRHRNSRGRG